MWVGMLILEFYEILMRFYCFPSIIFIFIKPKFLNIPLIRSISNTFCSSSPNGWSFGAWRIQGVIFFNLSYLLSKHNKFSILSLLYLSLHYSVFIDFFFFTMVIFFKQPYISNNRIFQRLYSFNINSIISSLIFITLTQ